MNAGTGDLGDDYAVVAFFDDNDLFNLAVIRTPTSNSATWSVTGTPGFAQNQNLLSLLWRHSEIGSPSQFRWNGEFSTLVDAGIDCSRTPATSRRPRRRCRPDRPSGSPGSSCPSRPRGSWTRRAGGAASKPFAGSTLRHTVAGVGPVPADAIAVALNVTATEAEGSGFVTVFPNGPSRPFVSNLNFTSGQNIANLVVSPIGSQGKVSFYAHQPTHLVADVMGYWVPAASLGRRPVPAPATASHPRHPLGRQAGTVPDHPVRRERPGRRAGQRRERGGAQPHAHGVDGLGLGRGVPRRDHVGRHVEPQRAGRRSDGPEPGDRAGGRERHGQPAHPHGRTPDRRRGRVLHRRHRALHVERAVRQPAARPHRRHPTRPAHGRGARRRPRSPPASRSG